ncbi:uncharacterized protein LAESUDRAFT_566389 [Laetiporus sulphureus 93-53]|uniref:UvrD-like helicase ATP-binding domain-containing protein n=1 Tax=Laetiporus sulphureus 93-53 TaxID=1314785 RepID=A0A165FG89_9APHY|nr:uncharacterized protein LAESUDRAFT_566389 [Laetiporus sulphureus 93-53]KZT08925.1 hypothetical protein LAESUDRAFT_566389 [Laetiporus sulphureus 93-53]
MNGFPSSVGRQLLEGWSHLLWVYGHYLDSQERQDMEDVRAKVLLAIPVLVALSSAFPASDSQLTHSDANKRAYAGTDNAAQPLVEKSFYDLGLRVPHNRNEAVKLGAHLIEEQKCHLRHFFNTLRHPRLVDELRNAYIPEQSYANLSTQQSTRLNASADLSSVLEHMRPSAHFDGVDGFGPWRVIILSRAEGDLRTARNKVPKLFDIISRKIRELSNGYFTDDNHRRLNTTHEGVSLYKGRLTGKLCYIYQIDCIPKLDENGDEQVIKLFGIFTLSKLNMSLWNGVSRELARRGTKYVERCNRRECERGGVIVPVCFNISLESPDFDPSSRLSTGPSEQLEQQVYSMLVLNTYVTLSKPLMNSILADHDVAMLFDLSKEEQKITDCASSCYVLGRSGTGKTTVILHKMLGIEQAWEHCRGALPRPRQLFVTKSRLLADNVENAFLRIYGSLSDPDDFNEIDSIMGSRRHQSRGLVDRDEEAYRSGELPQRFSDLTDEHFPLFLSYSQLCRMLEAEYEPREPHIRLGLEKRTGTISYKQFLSSYWPHFPQHLTNGLDSALVYNEIIGVIEGSEETAVSRGGKPLDEKFYLEMSDRIAGTFFRQRSVIYQLYLAYSKCKRERGEFDAADRSHELLRNLQEHGLSGFKLDFIYADEVQDNLLIDALVLRTICSNPRSGLLWAGDTAQTISDGCTFRFEDLKALLYRAERRLNPRLASSLRPPDLPLTTNHRSHEGIVRCARLVVELLVEHWPESIDQFKKKERGEKDGPKPVFLRHWKECTLHGNDLRSRTVLFGAQQCVLVRSDRAREELNKRAGDIGLILTLQECKGLEFNDVLLYDFFSDSNVPLSEWRLIVNNLHQRTLGQSLCRELKFLYVAITRARLNIWMVDDSEKAKPMRALWNGANAIHDGPVDTSFAALATPSAPSEWARTAEKLFNEKQYERAAECYERALRPREKAVKAYEIAARAFLQSAKENTEEKRTYFRISAECFIASGLIAEAAKTYEEAFEYTLSAQYYRQAGWFDEAVRVVKQHRMQIPPKTVDEIVDVARMFYFMSCDVAEIHKATNLFEAKQDGLRYIEDLGFGISARLSIVKAIYSQRAGLKEEAVNFHLSDGNVPAAMRSIVDCSQNLQWAAESLLRCLWRSFSLGTNIASSSVSLEDFLRQLSNILNLTKTAPIKADTYQEMLIFKALLQGNDEQLLRVARDANSRRPNDMATLLCLDYVFSNPTFYLNADAKAAVIADNLQLFLALLEALRSLAFRANLPRESDIQTLMQFEPVTGTSYLIRPKTLLYDHCKDTQRFSHYLEERGYVVPEWHMDKLLQKVLRHHIIERINQENRAFRQAIALTRTAATNDILVPPRDESDYYLQIRIHLQQILVYHHSYGLQTRRERIDQESYWLQRFFDDLHPVDISFGSALRALRTSAVPELEKGITVIKYWVQDLLYERTFTRDILRPILGFLSMGLASSRALCDFLRWDFVSAVPRRRNELTRPADGVQVVEELLSFMRNDNRLSLLRGVFFVRYILEHNIIIDITLLCDLLDDICGWLVVARCYEEQSSLHDVILPLDWLVRSAKRLRCIHTSDTVTSLLPIYFEPLADLLEQLYTGGCAGHIRYQGQSVTKPGNNFKHIAHRFIARICKNLHFLGLNLQYRWLKDDLLATMGSIGKAGRNFPQLYAQYVTVDRWDDLTSVPSLVPEFSGQMIQLHDKRISSCTSIPVSTVRHVWYSTLEEIPQVVQAMSPAPQFSMLDAGFAPDTLQHRLATARETDFIPPETNAARKAASVLLHAYRISRHVFPTGLVAAMRQHFFLACREEANKISWPCRHHRLLFLGAVPHILVCLELLAEDARSTVRKVLDRMRIDYHKDLEARVHEAREAKGMLDKVMALQQSLGVKSKVHKTRNLQVLLAQVREVEVLVRKQSLAQGDMRLAVRGVERMIERTRLNRIRRLKPAACRVCDYQQPE